MVWLTGYTYRKLGAVNSTTAGAQTLYQLRLIVGESSGASGCDVHCENHCLDFPNDIRFTKEDGETKHDYWIEQITSTTPNRKAVVWIEVAAIPASGSVDFYMYYRKTSDSGESNGGNTFEFYDDFKGADVEWAPYASNPVLSPEGDEDLTAWGSVWKEGDTYHYYYSYDNASNYHRIGHATSTDGKNWTKDSGNNPVLVASGGWEGTDVWDGSVWKEGSTWYMLYTGHRTACKIGLATASNPEGPWTKEATNPVMAGAGGWETNVENMQCMKIGSTYYLWYNILGGLRKSGLATSTDLKNWTKDANNPIFSESLGVFQPCPFKYGDSYYLLICAYTSGTDYSDIRLYRDTNPTFYPADRQLVKVVKSCPDSGWDYHDQDTPCVLSQTINRDSFVNDELWTYYAGESGGTWKTGLLIETNIDAALSGKGGLTWIKTEPANCTVELDSSIKKHGEYSYKLHDGSNTDKPKLTTTDVSRTSGVFGAWMRTTNSTGSGSEHFDIYLYEEDTLKLTVGFNDGTKKFHYYDGSFHDTAIGYSVDTWYLFTVEFDCTTDKFNFVVYDTGMSEVCRVDDISFPAATTITKITFLGTNGYLGDGYVDVFRACKYALPHPTWDTWGAEDSESETYTKTITADGYLVNNETKTFTCDVVLKATRTKTFTADANITLRHTKTFTTDANCEATFTTEILLENGENVLLEDGEKILLEDTIKKITVDAHLTTSFNLLLEDGDNLLLETGYDLLIEDTLPLQKEFVVDGYIKGTFTKGWSSDAILTKTFFKTFSADAALLGQKIKGFTTNAILRRIVTRAFTVDGFLTKVPSKTFSADGIIRYGGKSFIVDGLLSTTNTKELTVDAELTHVKQFTVDGGVGEPWGRTRGFYYSKLGTDNLHNPPKISFSITTELNNIASFDYVIQNDAHNRDIIANNLTDDFSIMRDDDTELLRCSIDSDSIEYFTEGEGRGRRRIRLSGFANFVDLKYLIYKRMATGDAEDVGSVQDEDNSTSTFTDYTTEANNATMDDVLLTFGAVDDALYIGKDETFFAAKIKYSTKGIQAANTTVVMEYSKGSGVWATLDCIDESYSFTEDAGTYLLYIPNKADDWVKDTINGKNQYHIRFRLTEGSYTLSPKLDQIKLSNADVCRVQFNDTPADTILGYLLEDTGYTEDATDQCPSTEITIRGEYDSKLRWIFGLGSALTWEDGNGDKKRYDCWIDTSKKVHYKQHRGTDQGDISADFRALSNKIGYGEMGTRIFGTGGQEGINQKKAVVEDLTAQGEHKLREIVLEDNRITAYEAIKEEALKSLANRKNPLKDVTGDLDTKYWLDNTMDVGDKITVHQPDWNLNNQDLYVMRAVIGPSATQLDLGNSQIHLEHLRSTLQRQMDIGNVWMHGSVSTYVAGPEEDNYERKDDTTAYPLRFTIEVPDNARGINHVEIGWELMDYKSSVDGSGAGGGHSHTSGPSSRTGAHDHTTGPSAGGGAHDHNTGSEGDHVHVITTSGIHWHTVDGTITTQSDTAITSVNMNDAGGHSHTNPTTGSSGNNDTAVVELNYGDACAVSGNCVTDVSTALFATDGHTHTQGSTGYEADHHHPMGGTQAYFIYNIADITGWTSSQHDGHDHPESTEGNHWHATNTASAHTHTIPNTNTEDDHEHTIPESSTETDHEHPIAYGVHEIPGGTTLELYVGDELVGDTYVGDQSGINITGWITTGSNSITLKPVTTDHVKGRAKISATATVFLENLK